MGIPRAAVKRLGQPGCAIRAQAKQGFALGEPFLTECASHAITSIGIVDRYQRFIRAGTDSCVTTQKIPTLAQRRQAVACKGAGNGAMWIRFAKPLAPGISRQMMRKTIPRQMRAYRTACKTWNGYSLQPRRRRRPAYR